MSKTVKYLLIAGIMFLSASASALQLKPDAPQRYVVVKGDTLWDISGRFIGNPWEWPEIWYMNDQIENPHLIYPGDVIELVNVDGQMKLMVTSRGEASRTVKLSPTARVEPIANAIPAIPMDAIQGFMRNHQVLDRKGFENLPYVVAGEDGRVMMGAGTKVYGRLPEETEAMTSYGIGSHRRSPAGWFSPASWSLHDLQKRAQKQSRFRSLQHPGSLWYLGHGTAYPYGRYRKTSWPRSLLALCPENLRAASTGPDPGCEQRCGFGGAV